MPSGTRFIATIQPSWPDLIDLIRASTETGTVAPLSVDGRVKPGHDDEVNPVSESKHW